MLQQDEGVTFQTDPTLTQQQRKDRFLQSWKWEYGYNGYIDTLRATEFTRLQGNKILVLNQLSHLSLDQATPTLIMPERHCTQRSKC